MTRLFPLMQREWLQHRFGWAMLVLVPLALALPLLGFGRIQIESADFDAGDPALPVMLAAATIVATAAVLFIIATVSSWIIVSSLAHRDDGDRSFEFWLSLPAGHAESLAAPLLVHLLLVPAVALAIGLVAGHAMSLLIVGRVAGAGAWLSLPWGTLIAAALAAGLRVLAGLPLALLWLSPLILLVVLLTAWFRRWGWVILGVGIGLGSVLLKQLLGQPLLSEVLGALLRHARGAILFHARLEGGGMHRPGDAVDALRQVPMWALHDYGLALGDLLSPLLLGGLLFAAGCFALLIQWRERGAGAGG